jgi:hypothetical protein
MSHLEASASIGAFVLVILLAPAIIRGRAATTSARFGHGRSGIDVAHEEQHGYVGNVLDSCNLIAFWNLSFIEEDVLDRIRNPDLLDLTASVDVENGLGWCGLGLNTWLNFGLGRSRL